VRTRLRRKRLEAERGVFGDVGRWLLLLCHLVVRGSTEAMRVGQWVLRRRKTRSRKGWCFECGREGRRGIVREQGRCREGLKRRRGNDAV
jgi:hypothetical protein